LYVDSEITGTVLSATPRVVGNNRTIYDIAFSDGNTYTTFDAKIWAKVQQVGQQPATARVSVKQKDQFTNFYLNDIAPQGQLAATSAPVATPPPPQAARAPQSGGMSPEREQKIVKQSSFSTAFNFVGALYQGAGESEFGRRLKLAHGSRQEPVRACDGRAAARPRACSGRSRSDAS
jgi:hypothetical protein